MAGRVQAAHGFVIGGSPVTVTLPNPTTTGNALVVVYSCYYAGSPYSSISDNASPASTFGAPDVTLSGEGTLLVTVAYNITGRSGHAVTVALAGQYYLVSVIEVNGLQAAGFDKSNKIYDIVSSTTYNSTATPTTSQADEYLIGAHARSAAGTDTAVPDSPWSKADYVFDGTYHRLMVQDRVVSSVGAYSSTGATGASANPRFTQNLIATYKLASGAPSPITGTFTTQLDDLTLAGTGAVADLTGSLSQQLDTLTLTSAGTVLVRGVTTAGSLLLQDVTLAPATGTVRVTGTLPSALVALQDLVATGTVRVTGTLSTPLDTLTLTGAGTVGAVPRIGTLTAQLADLTLASGTGTVTVTASLTTQLDSLSLITGTGTVAVHGTLATGTLDALTLTATAGVSTGAPITGTLTVLLDPLTLQASATVSVIPVCAHTTLADLQLLMQQRWDGVVFWTDEEARLALNEALREWNLLTGVWRTRVTLPLMVGNPEVALPRAMTYGMRVVAYGFGLFYPLTPTSLAELDLGRPTWRLETTASGGDVPTRHLLWAPLSLTRIAIWPTSPVNTGAGLVADGVLETPVLTNPFQTVDLNEEIVDYIVDMALHVVAFKEGGSRWRATRPYFEAFLQAAADENSVLKTNQRYRRFAGLDRRRDLQPSTGDANQIQGVATQFSRHDQPQQGGGQ